MKKVLAITTAVALGASTAFAGSTIENTQTNPELQDPTLMTQGLGMETWLVPLIGIGIILLAMSQDDCGKC